jgi:DNA-binding NarL/FixJ family response regulator
LTYFKKSLPSGKEGDKGFKQEKLSDSVVRDIKRKIASGISNIEIAELYDITPVTVSKIKTGTSHANVKIKDE